MSTLSTCKRKEKKNKNEKKRKEKKKTQGKKKGYIDDSKTNHIDSTYFF